MSAIAPVARGPATYYLRTTTMSYYDDETPPLSVSLILLAILIPLLWWLASARCEARWRGMETSWGIVQGCLVKTKAGEWIPDDRIRDIPSK